VEAGSEVKKKKTVVQKFRSKRNRHNTSSDAGDCKFYLADSITSI